MMTLTELDVLLADWQQKTGTIAHNLYEFCELPTYQRLMGTGGMSAASLTGITQQQVTQANADFTYLYQLFERLRETLDRAQQLRSQMPRRGGENLIAEIETLLKKPVITLPIQVVPIASREITSASELIDRITLENLLTQMAELFTRAKPIVLQIDAVWNQLELQLADLQKLAQPILQEMQSLIQASPLLVPPALQQSCERFHTQFAEVHQTISADPLMANEQMLEPLATSLKGMQQHLLDLQTQRQSVLQNLEAGQRSLQELRNLHREAETLFPDWQDKVTHTEGTVNLPPTVVITELTQWLDRLNTAVQNGNFLAAQVGLQRWQQQFDRLSVQVQSAIDTMTQALQLRLELRGRLTAMKAKAVALGRAEDPVLSTIETQLKQQLYSRPTNLQQSQAWMADYERSVNYR